MTHYFVVSPEMRFVEPVLDDGSGPISYECIVVSVDAPTKRAALIAGIKHPDMYAWVSEARGDGVNPFKGVKVENAVCPHGVCGCDMCHPQECEACYAEAEAEAALSAGRAQTGGEGE